MSKAMRAGVVAIAAVALAVGLAGCGSDKKTETTSSSSSPTSTSTAAPAGAHKTIVDYIKENGITEASVKRGDPGSPTIDLPFPPGWEDAGPKTPEWAYGAIVSTDPAFAADPPTVIALVSKLTGHVDPAKILEFAPGEIQNLPGYEGATAGTADQAGRVRRRADRRHVHQGRRQARHRSEDRRDPR